MLNFLKYFLIIQERTKHMNTKNIFLFFFIFSTKNLFLTTPILIITHAFNRPDFIEIQQKTFKKFFKDPYTFIVFNDGRDPVLRNKIQETCEKLDINCIDIPQAIHDKPYLYRRKGEDYNIPSVRTANAVQYSLDILGFEHNGNVMIIDSDMFLIKKFSIFDFLKDYDFAGVPQVRGIRNYVWNGLLFFNMKTIPNKFDMNFNCGIVEDQCTDTGGYMYYYLKNNPLIRIRYFSASYLNDFNQEYFESSLVDEKFKKSFMDFIKQAPDKIEFFLDYTFLHYRSGGNWNNQSENYHRLKTVIFNTFIDSILE